MMLREGWLLPTTVAVLAHGAVLAMPVLGGMREQSAPPATMQVRLAPAKAPVQPPAARPQPPRPRPTPKAPEAAPLEALDPAPVAAAAVTEVAALPRPTPVAAPVDLGAYGRGVYQSIARHRRYPAAAREMGMEGTALIRIAVTPEGRLVGEPTIERSTGHAVLDREALRMVREAGPFEPLPAGFLRDRAVIVIPVEFVLGG